MTSRERRTVPLPAEHAEHVAGRRLRIGKRVVRAGLRALQELEAAAIDQWSQDEVAPVYDAMQREPHRAVPAGEVSAAPRAFMESRKRVSR